MENKGEQEVDIEKALAEKRQMQKIFVREQGCPSSVLTLLIGHLEQRKENEKLSRSS